MKRLYYIVLCFSFSAGQLCAQAPCQIVYDGSEMNSNIKQTTNGGYIWYGQGQNYAAEFSDFTLLQLDAAYSVLWSYTYSLGANEAGYGGFNRTSDGGYILTGYSNIAAAGNEDLTLIKVDAAGNIQWDERYGGSSNDKGETVIQTTDGGYIAFGSALVTFSPFNMNYYLLKTTASGNQSWGKHIGGSDFELPGFSVLQTSDGGYIFTGATISYGQAPGTTYDIHLVKTNSAGAIDWTKTYGGTGDDYGSALIQTTDGGYLIAGNAAYGNGANDAFLLKTDASGNFLWGKTYGGAALDQFSAVVQTTDGGFAAVGLTWSWSFGQNDAFLVRTDATGAEQWSRRYGWTNADNATSISQTSSGGFLIGGNTVTLGGGGAYFIVTDASGVGSGSCPYEAAISLTDVSFTPGVSSGGTSTNYGSRTNANFSRGSGGTVRTDVCAVLPVELASFSATQVGEGVLLLWETMSEKNCEYFAVQKSNDGIKFETIGRVRGSGSSDSQNNYSFTDRTPLSSPNGEEIWEEEVYYRLQQVDYDGGYTYSNVLPVNINWTAVRVYPSVVGNELYCELLYRENGDPDVSITGILGNALKYYKEKSMSGNDRLVLDVSDLSPGIYFLKINSVKHPVQFKFIKQ